jgi:hypothetical protein
LTGVSPPPPSDRLNSKLGTSVSWHKCEVPTASSDVRYWGQSGTHLLRASISHLDPNRTNYDERVGLKLL